VEISEAITSRLRRAGPDRVCTDGRIRGRLRWRSRAEYRAQYQQYLLLRRIRSCVGRGLRDEPAPKSRASERVLSRESVGELFSRSSEFVPFDHEPDSLVRSPHHSRPGDQFQSAAVFENRRPTDRHIHPGARDWRLPTPQTHSSAAHVHGFGADRRVPFVRLQDGVAGFPPKWKSPRSTALIVHVLMMRHI